MAWLPLFWLIPAAAVAQAPTTTRDTIGEEAIEPAPEGTLDSTPGTPPSTSLLQESVPPPPGAEPSEGETADGAQPSTQLQLIVVDAATYGIDPVVGRHVSTQIRETGVAMGYTVMDGPSTVAAAQQLRMPYPPSPADVWRVTYISHSQRGAFARVWAHSGRYVIEITVASLDGTGPFSSRATSGAADLHEVVNTLVREVLPLPTTWSAEGATQNVAVPAPPGSEAQPGAASVAQATDAERPPANVRDEDAPTQPQRRRVPRQRRPRHRFQLALQTEAAFGTSDDSFYNHLFGLRADYRISREVFLGAYLGYANLRGKNGRVGNLLPMLQIEDRVSVTSSSDITIPLRLGLGYLPFNGPVVRLAAGLNIPLSREWQLGLDILTPTFWVLPDRTAVSLDVAAEIIYRL